jgi:hypothetical protein
MGVAQVNRLGVPAGVARHYSGEGGSRPDTGKVTLLAHSDIRGL